MKTHALTWTPTQIQFETDSQEKEDAVQHSLVIRMYFMPMDKGSEVPDRLIECLSQKLEEAMFITSDKTELSH